MSRGDFFTVEGRLAVEALIETSSFRPETVLLEEGRHDDLRRRLRESGIAFQIRSREDLRSEAGYEFHRGVLAHVRRPTPVDLSAEELDRATRLVLPVALADPGNLGTVVRNAAAFGADGIVMERNRGADIWSRKAIRASATGVFRVPVYEPSSLAGFLERAREAGFVAFGTSLSGRAKPLKEVKTAAKSLILLGTEKDGLGSQLEAHCDELINIPMYQGMDSLNVGSTSAIVCQRLFQPED